MDEAIAIFKQEAVEHLANLEIAILALEDEPSDEQHIDTAFRAMHTIKGSSGMVGFDHLCSFTHELESLFDKVRNKQLAFDNELCQLTLNVADHINTLLSSQQPSQEALSTSEALLTQIIKWQNLSHNEVDEINQNNLSDLKANDNSHSGQFKISITPSKSTFTDGFDLIPLVRELKAVCLNGEFECETNYTFDDTFDAQKCYLTTKITCKTDLDEQGLLDIFIFVQDDWEINIEHISDDSIIEEAQTHNPNNQSNQQTEAETQGNTAISAKQYPVNKPPEHFVKVPQSKLDRLMEQVGELVIMQAGIDAYALKRSDEEIQQLSEDLSRLTNDLREVAFEMRMLPIGSTFSRFKRLVRDTAKDLGKKVRLKTTGGETELDKVVLDQLGDPLVHLLRNSLDHGFESTEVRLQKGKSEYGTLSLKAMHYQGQIAIEISDDGAGLNTEVIREKAIEKGLISTQDNLTEHEICQLIFEPGFSTAKEVSDISGRGVGMDVVRTSIEALQGHINISSEKDKGTSVRIQLPMTLSIIDGLLVSVGSDYFVLPLNQVQECIELDTETETERQSDKATQICHRNRLIPNISLRKTFAIDGKPPAIQQSIIVQAQDVTLGITVDEVEGNHQTVIRDMGKLYRDTPGIMGATILGDGSIAMILDLNALTSMSQ